MENLIDAAWNVKFEACDSYPIELLEKLYPEPKTLLEVLTCRAGLWESVSDTDRIWVITRERHPWTNEWLARLVERANPKDPRSIAVIAALRSGEVGKMIVANAYAACAARSNAYAAGAYYAAVAAADAADAAAVAADAAVAAVVAADADVVAAYTARAAYYADADDAYAAAARAAGAAADNAAASAGAYYADASAADANAAYYAKDCGLMCPMRTVFG